MRLSCGERSLLETLIRKGGSPAHRLLKARILLKADVFEAGEGCSDNQIIQALATSASMVYRVRKQLVEEGAEAVLSRKPRATPSVPRIFDGEKEAKLIAEFPFVGAVDRAVAMSALITPIARKAMDVAPLHAFTAPAIGTGKSYLTDTGAAIRLGSKMPSQSARDDVPGEMDKGLGAASCATQQCCQSTTSRRCCRRRCWLSLSRGSG